MNPQPPCQSFSKSFVIKPSRHRHFFFLVFFVLFSLFPFSSSLLLLSIISISTRQQRTLFDYILIVYFGAFLG